MLKQLVNSVQAAEGVEPDQRHASERVIRKRCVFANTTCQHTGACFLGYSRHGKFQFLSEQLHVGGLRHRIDASLGEVCNCTS